jgi:SAM-dependent methyltransferase
MNTPDLAANFIGHCQRALDSGAFARLTLSQPVAGDDRPEKIFGRLVVLRGATVLSLTLRYATRDVTRNLPLAKTAAWLREQLGTGFRSAWLAATGRDWQLVLPAKGRARLVAHKSSVTEPPPRAHDEARQTALDAAAHDWLHGLGVTDAAGQVRAAMADKHRQIGHYLEILSHLAKDCGWIGALASGPTLHFADMGCGKGYLTFGAWHLFQRVWKQPVNVIGVEARPELVESANHLARQIKADGLAFVAGTIETVPLPPVDALIALHACTTATDDAIRRGIELGAKLIVVAPCCHKELRPQLGKPEPLASVLRHGLMEERLAEWLTDGLRALFLEWAGYRTKLIEFVASEHTPKNLMIAAVRERKPFANETARKRIEELKSFFGIRRHALDPLLVGADVRRLNSSAEPGRRNAEQS